MGLLTRFWSRDQFASKAAAELLAADWLVRERTLEPLTTRILTQAGGLSKAEIRTKYEAYGKERKLFAADPDRRRRNASESLIVKDGVAIISLSGLMMKEVPSAFDLFGETAVSTTWMRLQLAAALERSDVRSILILADTPGGTVDGTDALAEDVFRATKPVHVYGGDLVASAGIWVASQADRFTVGPTASIGSVGVYRVIHDTSKLFLEHGVEAIVISSGGVKGAIEDGVKVTAEAKAEVKRRIDEVKELFVAAVARGREMELAAARELATGQVWIGEGAVKRGLADAVETDREAFEAARQAANPSKTTEVVAAKADPIPIVVDANAKQPRSEERIEEKETTMKLADIYAKKQKGEALTESEQQAIAKAEKAVEPPAPPKEVPADVRAEMEKKDAKIAELEKDVQTIKAAQARAGYLKEADGFKYVPGYSRDEIADEIAAADAKGKEAGTKKRQHFATIDQTIRESGAFDVLGSSRTGDSTPMGQLRTLATELRTKNPKLSEVEALAEAGAMRPDLYDAAQYALNPLPN